MTNKTSNLSIGSEWKKWDLHLHSLYTNLENKYGQSTEDDFSKKIQETGIEVVGLTNYFNFSDNDFNLKEKLEKEGIKVFLNLELRLTYQNKEDECCDLHVIFDDELDKNKIQQFLSNLTVHVDTIDKKANELTTKADFKKGVVEFDTLKEKLNEKSLGMSGRYYIGFLSRGKGNARSSTVYGKIAENSNFLIHSSSNVDNLDKDRKYWLEKNKPLIQSSDSHSIANIGSKLTWIKTTPTFEGLKQIAYEPKYRISYNEPKQQLNYVSEIKLEIPTDAKVGNDKFCFAGNSSFCSLSPYFNCFIGGRGSGKSTILNFLGLHSNNPDSPNDFWGKLNPSFNPNDSNIFSFGGTEIFEFLAQSEIETFARDKSKFTQAIYNRANSHAGNILKKYEETVESLKNKLGQIIQATTYLKILEDQKFEKEKEKRTLKGSLKVLSSEEYNKIISDTTVKSKELQKLEDWKENIAGLRDSLTEFISSSESELKEEIDKTEYEKAYELAITKVTEAVELLKVEKFIKEIKKESEIKKTLIDLEDKAKTLIEKAGYTPESVEQIKSAPQKITNLEREIKNLTIQIETNTKIISTLENVVSELKTNKQNYETKITEILKPLQGLLRKQFKDNQGKDIKQISLKYFFDESSAWSTFANEFYNQFKGKYGDSERSREVCDFINDNKQTFSNNSFDGIKKLIQGSDKIDKKYIKFFGEVFKDENNFKIFLALRDKHLLDVKTNKIIQVKYDNRDVEQASFGQRCTAVVVILLLFGNYPLIIDEPEAHLDSSLIANYLVPLLKEKKSDRQIIFATHNANFVINGDAEKIFILKNNSGKTEIIETTIEDIKNREELLKLEGGKEAFEKRGEKLHIII